MTRYLVTCPQCGRQLFDDGSLSGQLVICPSCNGQFQIVAQPVEPPPLATPDITPSIRTGGLSRPHSRNESNKTGLYIALIMLAIGGFAVSWIATQIANDTERKPKRGLKTKPATWDDKGYRAGFEVGYLEASRRNGGREDRFCPFAITDDYIILEASEAPKPQTDAFVEFRRGFQSGHRDGWSRGNNPIRFPASEYPRYYGR